jgi:hypothetical protein
MAIKLTLCDVCALKFLGAYPSKKISQWDLSDHLQSKGFTGVQSQNSIDSMLYRDDYPDKYNAAFINQVIMGQKGETVGFLLTQRGRRVAAKLRGMV